MTESKLFLRALRRERCERIPLWLMRQAGRYLPEYRETRAKAGGFLELCLTPELAVEVTLQPIRRYGFDAAILFSDILIIPHGLGQKVWFEEGKGPCLEPLESAEDLRLLSRDGMLERLAPVMEILKGLRRELPKETALIGFAGAPWTVATYMIEGGSSRDFAKSKLWAYREPESFGRLIDLLVDSTTDYLVAQVEAGAEALQIFDSWAGALSEPELLNWSLEPLRRIVAGVKKRCPGVPVILFPKGCGVSYEAFANRSGADALSLDSGTPLLWARDRLQGRVTLQGSLDPLLLVGGGRAMTARTDEILETLGDGPFVFNLGHGILPYTPPEHVEALVARVRAFEPEAERAVS